MLYIDFDRTLFDTGQFVIDRDAVLKRVFGIAIKKADTKSFYRYIDDLYLYDFSTHMADLGLNEDDINNQLVPAIKQLRQSYVYDDARAIIDSYDFSVLTFGQDYYQKLKFGFAPELATKPKQIVVEHKDDYIMRHHQSQVGMTLVDDKIDATRGHPAINFIHLDRAANQKLHQDEAGIHINSLTELSNALNIYQK